MSLKNEPTLGFCSFEGVKKTRPFNLCYFYFCILDKKKHQDNEYTGAKFLVLMKRLNNFFYLATVIYVSACERNELGYHFFSIIIHVSFKSF